MRSAKTTLDGRGRGVLEDQTPGHIVGRGGKV